MKKIVFAGGTHAGKTTLLERFGGEGFQTVPEAGFQVIQEESAVHGMEFWAWRAENQIAFYELIAKRQIELEARIQASDAPVFLDRGIIDLVGFCRYLGCAVPELIFEYARKNRYDAVFIFETLSAPDPREADGRTFKREDSRKIKELVEAAYRELGYETITLPDMPVEEREKTVRQFLDTL